MSVLQYPHIYHELLRDGGGKKEEDYRNGDGGDGRVAIGAML